MDAGYEDLLTAHVGGLGRQTLVLTSRDQGQDVDDAEESENEKRCAKDSGPRRSGEAAKEGMYHGRPKELKQPRFPKEKSALNSVDEQIMITSR